MPSSAKHGMSISPSATTSSCSSTNPEETASSSSYFLPELIPLVTSRLKTLQDFFALRATCRTYRALLPPSPSNLASQAPLLLVPNKASSLEALFHLPLGRILRFRLPSPLGHHDPSNISFDSFGCRVTIEDSDAVGSHHELCIGHLLTGELVRLPDPPKKYEGIIFAADLVLAFNPYHHTVHYCRIGDKRWRAARCDEAYRLRDLFSLQGTLYALIFPNNCLAVVEIENSSVVALVRIIWQFEGTACTSLGAVGTGECIEYSLLDGSLHELIVDYPGRPRKDYAPFAWFLPSIC